MSRETLVVPTPRTRYRIEPMGERSREYFTQKYGTPTPEYLLEDSWRAVYGKSWAVSDGNPAALMYAMRSGFDSGPMNDDVYYGKIGHLGEIVHASELREIETSNAVASE